jgi:hypothetical protein
MNQEQEPGFPTASAAQISPRFSNIPSDTPAVSGVSRKMRIPSLRITACLAIAAAHCIAGLLSATAATTTFTDRTTFENSLTNAFFNNFNSVPDAFSSPVASVTGTGGTPSMEYTITAPTGGLGVFPDTGFKAIGNWNQANSIIFTFNTGNIFSAGGDLWLSDVNGNRLAGNITVSFSDGLSTLASLSVPSATTGAFGFAGITTDGGPLTTMTIQNSPTGYLNISNFSVAVPEPSVISLVLLAGGVGYLAVRNRRRRPSEQAVR